MLLMSVNDVVRISSIIELLENVIESDVIMKTYINITQNERLMSLVKYSLLVGLFYKLVIENLFLWIKTYEQVQHDFEHHLMVIIINGEIIIDSH